MLEVGHSDTLYSIFRNRVEQTPTDEAYCQYDVIDQAWHTYSWNEIAVQVAHWQQALKKEGLEYGDRVAMMLKNCTEWIVFDQAAISLGLVTVPLFSHDNVDNCTYILHDCGARLLLLGDQQQLDQLRPKLVELPALKTILCLSLEDSSVQERVFSVKDWLAPHQGKTELVPNMVSVTDLATLVYTSGTTGKPKGVMLTHGNIIKNALYSSKTLNFDENNTLLSFLPLSHIFERVAGYYMTIIIGARVVFARSINTLLEDLKQHRPTVLLSVPRVYEQVYHKLQRKFHTLPLRWLLTAAIAAGTLPKSGFSYTSLFQPLLDKLLGSKVRDVFGGRLRYAVSGGAPMAEEIAHTLIALGIPIYQGYGLTEAAPVISVNIPGSNVPESVGMPISGIEVRIDDNGELLTRSDCVMQGYWNLPEATKEAIDHDGWLHTGDIAQMDAEGRLFITGRIKEIIVMSNGEKVPPADMEMALLSSPLISQVMIYGEARPFLIALVVVDREIVMQQAGKLGIPENSESLSTHSALVRELKKQIKKYVVSFPAYAKIRQVVLVDQPWTVESNMLTPTLKMKRTAIVAAYADKIEAAYRRF